MKLLTHNMLTSNFIKGVVTGFPLGIEAKQVEKKEVDYNPDFIARIIPKLDWPALCKAAKEVGVDESLPEEVVSDYEANEEFLKKVHNVLLQVEVLEGDLVCPESGRKFPVTNGIPNMMLNQDEI